MKANIFLTLCFFILVCFFENSYGWDPIKETKKAVTKGTKEIKRVSERVGKQINRTDEDIEKIAGKVVKAGEDAFKDIVEEGDRLIRDVDAEIDRTGRKVERAREKLAREWNDFREHKIDPIGDAIALIYYALKEGTQGFPKGFGKMSPRRLISPEATISLSSELLNKILRKLTEKSIPLDRNNPNSNNYIHFRNFNVHIDSQRQVILLVGSDGIIGFKSLVSGIRLKGITLEIFPSTRVEQSKILLDIYARITHLNIDKNNNTLDKSIAHGIQREVLLKGPLASLDITDSIKVSLPYINRNEEFDITVKDAAIYFQRSNLYVDLSTTADRNSGKGYDYRNSPGPKVVTGNYYERTHCILPGYKNTVFIATKQCTKHGGEISWRQVGDGTTTIPGYIGNEENSYYTYVHCRKPGEEHTEYIRKVECDRLGGDISFREM